VYVALKGLAWAVPCSAAHASRLRKQGSTRSCGFGEKHEPNLYAVRAELDVQWVLPHSHAVLRQLRPRNLCAACLPAFHQGPARVVCQQAPAAVQRLVLEARRARHLADEVHLRLPGLRLALLQLGLQLQAWQQDCGQQVLVRAPFCAWPHFLQLKGELQAVLLAAELCMHAGGHRELCKGPSCA
jgi:hypothetical protein